MNVKLEFSHCSSATFICEKGKCDERYKLYNNNSSSNDNNNNKNEKYRRKSVFLSNVNRFHKFSFGFSVNDLSVLYCSTATINTRVIKCLIYMFDMCVCEYALMPCRCMFMHWNSQFRQGSKCFESNKTEHAVAKLAHFQCSNNKARSHIYTHI